MSAAKALLYALVITVLSVGFLTLLHGVPTARQLEGGATTMFVVAFFLLWMLPGSMRRNKRGGH